MTLKYPVQKSRVWWPQLFSLFHKNRRVYDLWSYRRCHYVDFHQRIYYTFPAINFNRVSWFSRKKWAVTCITKNSLLLLTCFKNKFSAESLYSQAVFVAYLAASTGDDRLNVTRMTHYIDIVDIYLHSWVLIFNV